MKSFPSNFLWGAAIASYQVEGGSITQWSEWELTNATRLAREYSTRFAEAPLMEELRAQGEDPINYVCGHAIDHQTRYKSDFKLLKELGINSFRFSLSWTRIEPTKGRYNRSAIEWYRKYIRDLRKMGITPVVNLWHFAYPVWFDKMGGFTKHSNIEYYIRYVRHVIKALGPEIDIVLTINEPMVYALESFITGNWPPNKRKPITAFRVVNNLVSAHNRAYKEIKRIKPTMRVSFAKNSSHVHNLNPGKMGNLSLRIHNYARDDYFFMRTRNHMDFIAINWYQSDSYDTFAPADPPRRASDLNWDMNPADIEFSLYRLWGKYHLPILITENGLADALDKNRTWWLRETTSALRRALDRGVPVFGYLHWSAFDNFEWDKGFWPRFGLIEIDRENNLERKPRKSYYWYKDFINHARNNAPHPDRAKRD